MVQPNIVVPWIDKDFIFNQVNYVSPFFHIQVIVVFFKLQNRYWIIQSDLHHLDENSIRLNLLEIFGGNRREYENVIWSVYGISLHQSPQLTWARYSVLPSNSNIRTMGFIMSEPVSVWFRNSIGYLQLDG